MRAVPVTLTEANALVREEHRHHQPVQGHRVSIGVEEGDKVVGAVVVGRPVSRILDSGADIYIAEATRCVTDGTKNACSFLYSRAARAAGALGYDLIQTYTLAEEEGTSLRAAGWVDLGVTVGGQWNHTDEKQLRLDGGTRRSDQPTGPKRRWGKALTSAGRDYLRAALSPSHPTPGPVGR